MEKSFGVDAPGVRRILKTQTSIHYPPIHQFTYYRQRYADISLPVTEKVAAREVTLPLYPGLRDDEFDWVISAIAEALSSERVFTPTG